jgi:chemotaxis protein MotB
LAVTGCVSKGTYVKKAADFDRVDQELAALQKKHGELLREQEALKAELSTANRDKDRLTVDKRELEQTLQAKSDTLSRTVLELRQKNDELVAENDRLRQAKEEKVQQVSATYEQLLDKMKKEIAAGEVTISELKGKLTVNMVEAILFDSGKAEVKSKGVEVLQKVVDILKGVKDKSIRVEGYTDNVPIVGALTRKYPTNWELSSARAINVTRYLQQQGIAPEMLSAIAYGEYKPVADNATEVGRAKNRRIEIVLLPKE